MTKAAFIPINGGLFPVDADGREVLESLKPGKQVLVNIHSPRNILHHRLLFYLLRKVIEGGAWDGDEKSLLDYCKIGVGHVDTLIGPDGRTHFIPRSIAFESLPQDKFTPLFERIVWLVSTRLLGKDDWEALRDEIMEAAEGDLGRQARELAERYG